MAEKRVYLTATRANDGKTAVSLGLTLAFLERTRRIGFIKPLGFRTLRGAQVRLHEDALLVQKVCQVHCSLNDMNPVVIDSRRAEELFREGGRDELMETVRRAYRNVSEGKDLVVIEGTGHACVGDAYGLSNAYVAKDLAAKVVLVSSGGIGHPIDEIALNVGFFEKAGVEVAGVIINRVQPHEAEVLRDLGRKALERRGVRLFGLIPHEPLLGVPTVRQVLEGLEGELLNGEENLRIRVGRVLIGAMTPHVAIDRLVEHQHRALLITSGDRTDMILAALAARALTPGEARGAAGLVLTGGIKPPASIMRLIERTDLPVIAVGLDSFTAAIRVHDLEVKIDPTDREKVDRIRDLIRDHVDTAAIYEAL